MLSDEQTYDASIRETLLNTPIEEQWKINPYIDVMKKDYFDKEFQNSPLVENNFVRKGKYYGASRNQNPYDLIAHYNQEAQELLKKWVRLNLIPVSKDNRQVCTYSVKHWAEDFFKRWDIDGAQQLEYISTGAIKGALMSEGFYLKPYEFNAFANISTKSPAFDYYSRLYLM